VEYLSEAIQARDPDEFAPVQPLHAEIAT